MDNNAQKFLNCLKDADQILEDYPFADYSDGEYNISHPPSANFDLALFEDWSKFSTPETLQKSPVRVIQHLACTGGTVISKCLAAMPNVVLLSEANPLSTLQKSTTPRFAPTDLTYLAMHGGFPLIDELSEKIFRADIEIISKHAQQLGKYLVIREHSHSDFHVGELPNSFSTIRELLKDDHTVLSVVTVRHPVDSYLSLIKTDWVHYTPKSFDEYCRRYLLFLESNKNVPLHKYEDFVNDPQLVMKKVCETLDLPFNEDFQDVFDLNTLTGDSGRSSSLISTRKRREFDECFREELNNSTMFFQLCEKLNYETFLN
jgi:hypothetical protein